MKIDPSLYCRTGTAAKLAGVTPAYIVTLALEGRLRGFNVCGIWFILRSDASDYQPRDPSHKAPQPRPQPTPKINPADYVTAGTAAALAGVARQHVTREARGGRLAGIMLDGQWLILRSAAESYERDPVRGGRPRIHPLPKPKNLANQRLPQPTGRQKRA